MSVALQIIQMIFYIVGILFMLSFMFIGIWSFIVFLKMAKNQRIQTFLLEKINKSISALENDTKKNDPLYEPEFLMDDSITNDDDNIIKFDDNIK